jgi:hypothetical protein
MTIALLDESTRLEPGAIDIRNVVWLVMAAMFVPAL